MSARTSWQTVTNKCGEFPQVWRSFTNVITSVEFPNYWSFRAPGVSWGKVFARQREGWVQSLDEFRNSDELSFTTISWAELYRVNVFCPPEVSKILFIYMRINYFDLENNYNVFCGNFLSQSGSTEKGWFPDTFTYASFNELWCFNLNICSFWTIVHFLKTAITLLILPWEMCPATYYILYDLFSFRKSSFELLKTFGASSVSPILTSIIKHISMTLFFFSYFYIHSPIFLFMVLLVCEAGTMCETTNSSFEQINAKFCI